MRTACCPLCFMDVFQKYVHKFLQESIELFVLNTVKDLFTVSGKRYSPMRKTRNWRNRCSCWKKWCNRADISDWSKSPSDKSRQRGLTFNILYMVRHSYHIYRAYVTAGSRQKQASLFLARCLCEI